MDLEFSKTFKTPYIVACRGRNPDNPSDRRAGIKLVQRLEINTSGFSNALTTVLKDNWVLEIKGNLMPIKGGD